MFMPLMEYSNCLANLLFKTRLGFTMSNDDHTACPLNDIV